ncbi:MAG: hypothetical protein ABI383_16120 [Acidobacteriaceae bacterium]
MPSTHKRVIVRRLDRDSVSGFVGASYIQQNKIELLNAAGKLVLIPLEEVKAVYFVRDLENSEEIVRKSFPSRPRAEGLWVRLIFNDQEMLEGLMGNELSQFAPDGFLIAPPDTRGNTQRIFVPRSSLQSFSVLAVIGGIALGKKRPAAVRPAMPQLFAENE